ncbi:hypothetical protein [Saccharothrix obliqua]|uniref:hypothetical protein n=1 Tax=Saccharothrix obliqua TaxID=2861747 RepID=UPI001C5E26CB|nr:hypothetical protein [Saccharothrix obliqua]MBW4716783.1 hypothetical protein [Saccharothrix obliqua]
MSEFETVLHDQVSVRLTALDEARRAGLEHEIHLHSARIKDLLDVAARHDIDVTGWVAADALQDD